MPKKASKQKNMNKRELEQRIAEKTLMTKVQTGKFLEAFQEAIEEGLREDGRVTISRFGVFNLAHRKEKEVVNPSNLKEKVKVPARDVPIFKVSEAFRDKFN